MKLVSKLEKAGHRVRVFTEYHLRINGEIDLFPNDKGRSISWHDRFLNTRGRVPEDQILFFVNARMNSERTEQATKESFINTATKACGWTLEEAEKEWKLRTESQKENTSERQHATSRSD